MYTIIETPTFSTLAEKMLSQAEHDALTAALLHDPEAGDVIAGGGGIRKLRIALQGRGKSGGARVIYFFINRANEIHLIFIYAKNKRENITAQEKAIFKAIAKELQE